MNGPAWTAVGGIVVALITGAFLMWGRSVDRKANLERDRLAAEQAEKTRVLETQKVSRDDFDSITRELRASLEDTREQLDEARRELRAAREDIKGLRKDLDEEQRMRRNADERADENAERAERAERKVERLTRRVDQLESALRGAGVTVPSPLPDLVEDPGV